MLKRARVVVLLDAQLATDVAKLKICLVGDEGVGKTSLIRRFVHQEYSESYIRTVGTMVSKHEVDLPEVRCRAMIMVWDIMGRRDFMDLFKESYFKNAGGILAVFDLTRPATMESLREWIGNIRASEVPAPTFILANKVDSRPMDGLSDLEVNNFAKSMYCAWLRTSAKTGENVEAAFRNIALRIIQGKSPRGR